MDNQEIEQMTNAQYNGILDLIEKLIKEDTPKEKLLECIEELKAK